MTDAQLLPATAMMHSGSTAWPASSTKMWVKWPTGIPPETSLTVEKCSTLISFYFRKGKVWNVIYIQSAYLPAVIKVVTTTVYFIRLSLSGNTKQSWLPSQLQHFWNVHQQVQQLSFSKHAKFFFFFLTITQEVLQIFLTDKLADPKQQHHLIWSIR